MAPKLRLLEKEDPCPFTTQAVASPTDICSGIHSSQKYPTIHKAQLQFPKKVAFIQDSCFSSEVHISLIFGSIDIYCLTQTVLQALLVFKQWLGLAPSPSN